MSTYSRGDTNFTGQLKVLLNKIYGRSPLKDSVLERAITYYDLSAFIQKKLDALAQNIAELKSKPDNKSAAKIIRLEGEQKEYHQELTFESHERFQHLQAICLEILELSEGENLAETNRKSAQLLGSIQLLCPTEGKKVSITNECSKPLYKGVLALRLLDQLCLEKLLPNSYIDQAIESASNSAYANLFIENKVLYQQFVDRVKIPVLMAALLQDIGNYHPEAQKIITGQDGQQDCFRTLSVEERKALLQINYRETVKYLINGIGANMYTGNSKVEREEFKKQENSKLLFIKHLLKSSVQPKLGLGNLLKIPQIYTSIILSTKEGYNYKLLPKVYQALYQNAERGICRKDIVDLLYKITGTFPQGYGVAYIPSDIEGNVHYEYAIVTQLYPENPEEPICRSATRNLTFVGYGHDIVVKKSNNLYYVETAKLFSKISKERLNEILELLSSNYHERQSLDLLPRCWQPTEYFSMKNNQKLWNRSR
ncbi:hypothetical protein [Cognaticolwellia mytili]|uniref:hypothetical protein n=1 Tax=Cognaticolwellia mytili TaxID=1888913 RepID=UPI000A1773B9|nr:hypothetical protein [Cognaticolwellia mytili]